MKKALKGLVIAVLALLALVIIATGVASWILFSKSGLKKTAAYAIENFSPCKIDVGDISLSIRKTFPEIGLSIDDVVIHNVPGTAPSDTMAYLGKLTLQVDADAYRYENTVKVRKIFLDDALIDIFTDAEGNRNIDVFKDNVREKAERTSTLPDSLDTRLTFDLSKLSLNKVNARYTDDGNCSKASVKNLSVDATGHLKPSLVGNADIDIQSDGIEFSNGDTLITAADCEGVGIKANVSLQKHIADGNVELHITSAGAIAGGISTVMSGLDIGLDGKCDLDEKSVDGDISLRSSLAKADASSFNATAESLDLTVDADGKYSLNDIINAVVKAKTGNVRIRLNGESPISSSFDNIGLSLSTKADAGKQDGIADISLTAGGVALNMEGGNPIQFASKMLELNADGFKDGDIINCSPNIYSSETNLLYGNETYIPEWPVRLYLPFATDTTFRHFNIGKGDISLNNQEISLQVECDLAGNGDIDADASVSFERLDIATLLSMLPSNLEPVIEGIVANGLLSLNAKGKASLKDGILILDNTRADVNADKFSGELNDSISAIADKLSISIRKSGKSTLDHGTYLADIKADNLKAGIVSNTPVNASLNGLDVKADLGHILDKEAFRSVSADIKMRGVSAGMDTIQASFSEAGINGSYAIKAATKEQEGLDAVVSLSGLETRLGDALSAQAGMVNVSAKARLDTTRQDFLLRWKPDLQVRLSEVAVSQMSVPLSVPELDFDFSLGKFDISESRINFGRSSFSISGDIRDIGAFLDQVGDMEGTLEFESDYTDMDELMAFISGFGREDASANTKSKTFAVLDNTTQISDTLTVNAINGEPDPFIVPERINIALNTHIKEMDFNRHRFHDLGGDITIKDGTLVLQELGFSSDAAEMQLTAIYKTPETNDLYTGLDFHLLNIKIDELIDLIPSVDSIVPMLKSFDGRAQFHLAAETHLNGWYMPKMPTLIGAAAIEGKDLQVMDNEVFNSIKKKLLMSGKAENKIDSLSVELQVLRNKVDLYPFLVHMDRYSAVIGGRHNINKALDCNYHISITQTPLPVRLGVNISGALSDIAAKPMRHIKLGKCLYDKTFSQKQMNATDERILEMKSAISETLKSNVR